MTTDALAELRARCPSARADEPLSRHTSWGIGGPADVYAEPRTLEEWRALWAWARAREWPVLLLGQGSNVLVSDEGIRGVVARLRGDFEIVRFEGADEVVVGAGALLPQLARAAAERGLSGAEPLVGIPGTVGGGLLTNAGTPEGDIGRLVQSVEVWDEPGVLRSLGREELNFAYRRSNLEGRWILSARLKLRPGERNVILATVEKMLQRRAERQPLGTKNCGSVFKNPPGDFAARLIEAAGLKGHREGGARVSPKHANFIENVGNATAADVHRLIAHIRRAVEEKFGVRLDLEVWPLGGGHSSPPSDAPKK